MHLHYFPISLVKFQQNRLSNVHNTKSFNWSNTLTNILPCEHIYGHVSPATLRSGHSSLYTECVYCAPDENNRGVLLKAGLRPTARRAAAHFAIHSSAVRGLPTAGRVCIYVKYMHEVGRLCEKYLLKGPSKYSVYTSIIARDSQIVWHKFLVPSIIQSQTNKIRNWSLGSLNCNALVFITLACGLNLKTSP